MEKKKISVAKKAEIGMVRTIRAINRFFAQRNGLTLLAILILTLLNLCLTLLLCR
jgi:hypothetical protein